MVPWVIATFLLSADGLPTLPPAAPPPPLPAVEQADAFYLYLLNPVQPPLPTAGTFRGYLVVGGIQVDAKNTRRRLISLIGQGMAENRVQAARCFRPRHGIRVEIGGKVVDYLICFECLRVLIFDGDREVPETIARRPEQAINDYLRQFGLKAAAYESQQ